MGLSFLFFCRMAVFSISFFFSSLSPFAFSCFPSCSTVCSFVFCFFFSTIFFHHSHQSSGLNSGFLFPVPIGFSTEMHSLPPPRTCSVHLAILHSPIGSSLRRCYAICQTVLQRCIQHFAIRITDGGIMVI